MEIISYCKFDDKLQGNLGKAPRITAIVLHHPGSNSVLLAIWLNLMKPHTSGIFSHFLDHKNADPLRGSGLFVLTLLTITKPMNFTVWLGWQKNAPTSFRILLLE